MTPKSSHRRSRLAPRCRLIISWLRIIFQGSVCSTVKMVRELGLERRETVRSLSAVKIEKKKILALVREDRGGLINDLTIILVEYVVKLH